MPDLCGATSPLYDAAMTVSDDIGWIGLDGPAPRAEVHGEKAALLASAAGAGLVVPPAFVLPPEHEDDLDPLVEQLETASGLGFGAESGPLLLSVRPSAPIGAGGMAPAILNIGTTRTILPALGHITGEREALHLYRRLIQSYGTGVLGLDDEEFEYALHDVLRLAGAKDETALETGHLNGAIDTCLALIEEAGEAFPEDPLTQLKTALAAMGTAWTGPRAQARRLAMGLEGDMPLALIVQVMALGIGPVPSGAGLASLRDEMTGQTGLTGRYLPQAQGEDALMGLRTPHVLTAQERADMGLHEPSLEDDAPDTVAALADAGTRLEAAVGDAVGLEFTLAAGTLNILEVKRAKRSARAAVQIAVDLAESGAISREEALLKIDPQHLEEQLHPAIDPDAPRDRVGRGLPASPGGASGPLVFSPDDAEAAAQRGEPAILALIETSPEDIRGMHAAKGVLTVRGGMTSHAAVVARGLGKPCIVGARDLTLDTETGELSTADNRRLSEGDIVTVDGTTGDVIAGEVAMIQPEATGAFATLLEWADEMRRLGVRVNADTGEDVATAAEFGAEGIGLCRTEHMFFQQGRISAMREMILAGTEAERRAALDKLLPMQRSDFVQLFEAMPGRPATVRLLDPPLHEFLPHGEAELRQMAATLDMPVAKVAARAAELAEFNPMLGNRGCRIGIAYPEIYEMQARAIFEAAIEAGRTTGKPVRPEIMIPLVSAVREIEILADVISRTAEAVRNGNGSMVEYTIGVMIETPRACLQAGEISRACGFLSFGTNDLTQMLYGLSRDDAGRFMPEYVAQGVYAHDPFHSLDTDGVGEIIEIAIARVREHAPDVPLGLCGEHGGDPASIEFCERIGLDYVSCSPFRVPVARLAAAQAAIRSTLSA
jgi:pyruvate,orthophosphate dikinase